MTIMDLLERSGVECFTRAEWHSPRQADGSYARRRITHPMPNTPALYHFVHITVTDDTDLPADGKEAARHVESFGLSTPPMVSYHDLVTNEARYFEGQNYRVKGTHTINDKNIAGYPHDLNMWGYATALMQNVQDEVTDEQVQLVAMCAAARELKGLTRKGAPMHPHRMFDWKACPGDKMFARMAEAERLKNEYVRKGVLPGMEDDMGWSDWTPAEQRDMVDQVATAVINRLLKTPVEDDPTRTVKGQLKKIDNIYDEVRDPVGGQ